MDGVQTSLVTQISHRLHVPVAMQQRLQHSLWNL